MTEAEQKRKENILKKTLGVAPIARVAALKDDIDSLTAKHTHVMLSDVAKAEARELAGTKNLSEALRYVIRELKRTRQHL